MKKLKMYMFLFFAIVAMNGYSQNVDCPNVLMQACFEYNSTIPLAVGSGLASDSNIACLNSSPNPVWFCFQVQQPGKINIKMTTFPNHDVDFACWGPFVADTITQLQSSGYCALLNVDTLSASHPSSYGPNPVDLLGYPIGNLVDCSYSVGGEEYIHIPNTQTNEWYIFLVTNYSNQPAELILESDPSSIGASNCDFSADMDDYSTTKMTLSPNPTSDLLTCVFETNRDRKLSIVDVSGRTVKSWESNIQKEMIDVKSLSNGVYFLKVEEDNRSYSLKFIRSRD